MLRSTGFWGVAGKLGAVGVLEESDVELYLDVKDFMTGEELRVSLFSGQGRGGWVQYILC